MVLKASVLCQYESNLGSAVEAVCINMTSHDLDYLLTIAVTICSVIWDPAIFAITERVD